MLALIDLRKQPERISEAIARPEARLAEARAAVDEILAAVRADGDAALCRLTECFDGVTLAPDQLAVDPSDLLVAWQACPPDLRDALERAAARIRSYNASCNEAVLRKHTFVADGVDVTERAIPVRRVGIYVPGGRAAYPSTVLMCAIPAQVAGAAEIVLCVPPGPNGDLPVTTAAAAHLVGLREVYRVGGAQAIAALAFGTETIRPVDMVVGPGNIYVALAKAEVARQLTVGVESLAGPSECIIIADEHAPPKVCAYDLIAQAEHGPGGFTLLVTWSDELARAVIEETERLVAASSRRDEIMMTFTEGGRVVICDGPDAAIRVANAAAPEHLQLLVADPAPLLAGVVNAGAVFCGYDTPVTLGDYVAGPSHVLPTGGTARFASALRPANFQRSVHVVTATRAGLVALGPVAATLAGAEGFPAHASTVAVRLGEPQFTDARGIE